ISLSHTNSHTHTISLSHSLSLSRFQIQKKLYTRYMRRGKGEVGTIRVGRCVCVCVRVCVCAVLSAQLSSALLCLSPLISSHLISSPSLALSAVPVRSSLARTETYDPGHLWQNWVCLAAGGGGRTGCSGERLRASWIRGEGRGYMQRVSPCWVRVAQS